jgi:ABC-type sugar transport system substrate-binding protein
MLTGCSTGNEQASPDTGVPARTIGYVDVYHAGAAQKRFFSYFTAGAERLGWNVKLQDAKGDPRLGVTQATGFVNQNVDAIVVTCFDTAVMRPAITAAKRKNIPIVALGCGVPQPEEWSAVYAEDERALSEPLAQRLIDDGAGKTAILYDTSTLAGRERYAYVSEALEKAGVDIVGAMAIDPTAVEADSRQAASSFLNSTPDLASIVTIFTQFGPPTVSAIKAAKKPEQVSVYGYYADSFGLPLLIAPDSPVKALTDGTIDQLGLVAVDQLLGHFEHGEPLNSDAAKEVSMQYHVFTQEDHPVMSEGYLGPYPVADAIGTYVDKWQSEYGLQ